MNALFYISAGVAVLSTLMVITRLNAVHALLYLVVSLLSAGVIFFVLGAPFVAILEVIIYAGAIMVLFVFVVMMLNLGETAVIQERQWLHASTWVGPSVLITILLAELVYMLVAGLHRPVGAAGVAPKQVGLVLFGPYVLGVELASMLLLAGLVGAYHLGRRAGTEGE
ncbi:MAG TPA: NADH-quinone oxidoreductase subunit J [Candidatus Acidoferrum sp.]|nr:NADH-quinone oxidoreductase subunit J [Candidatus Methylomirabilis sp.]HWU41200.1 NADH-quinone oxidoreductase subunit J [Candidatus Acidoferrum sp.]